MPTPMSTTPPRRARIAPDERPVAAPRAATSSRLGAAAIAALGLGAGVLGAGLLGACAEDPTPLVIARCASDLECGAGKVCEAGECVPKDNVSCASVQGGQAILQPGPPLVEFGEVDDATFFRRVVLRNIGNCTLTLFEANFEGEERSPFECPGCTPDRFPLELFPFREAEVELAFTPAMTGAFRDNLILLSDDAEFPEIRVPVRARFAGVPVPSVLPQELQFGYVPQGRTDRLTVKVANRGTGTAKLVVTAIELEATSTTSFALDTELTEPVEIAPLNQDREAGYEITVKYAPRDINRHLATLVIRTNLSRNGVIRVPLAGTSQTPAKVSVSPTEIRFGEVPLGTSTALPLTIVNEGGSPLEIRYKWGGTGLSTDLSALPQLVPATAPGRFTELNVFVTATAPREITGLLILETNDPARPTITIPVSAQGRDVIGAQVVKVDMGYENGDDSFFGNDFRNVDLTLENPFGLVCNKQNANPTNWGGFGQCSWVGLGATEEPERVVLAGAQQDGTYRVMVTYAEDCASLPTALLSGILGLSIDVILGAILGAPVPGLDPSQISDVIDDICFDKESSTVTLQISINGSTVREVTANLGRKGDYTYPINLVRQNGVFTVQ
jgi:hypothetical protein